MLLHHGSRQTSSLGVRAPESQKGVTAGALTFVRGKVWVATMPGVVSYALLLIVCGTVRWALDAWVWPCVGAAVVVLYSAQFLDGSENTVAGRPWPAFQRLRIWWALMRQFSPTFVQQSPLDRHKQYLFSCHPHGVLTANHVGLMTVRCGSRCCAEGGGGGVAVCSPPRRNCLARACAPAGWCWFSEQDPQWASP